MPYFLVIVLAPKVAFLNESNEVIVRRTTVSGAVQRGSQQGSLPSSKANSSSNLVGLSSATSKSALYVTAGGGIAESKNPRNRSKSTANAEESQSRPSVLNSASLTTIKKGGSNVNTTSARPKLSLPPGQPLPSQKSAAKSVSNGQEDDNVDNDRTALEPNEHQAQATELLSLFQPGISSAATTTASTSTARTKISTTNNSTTTIIAAPTTATTTAIVVPVDLDREGGVPSKDAHDSSSSAMGSFSTTGSQESNMSDNDSMPTVAVNRLINGMNVDSGDISSGDVDARITQTTAEAVTTGTRTISATTTSAASSASTPSTLPATPASSSVIAAPPPPSSSMIAESSGLESLGGKAVEESLAELTEVNIRGFVLGEMEKMFAEYILLSRPTLVDDETGNSIQAMCICEKERVDEVIARFAFYGVGNLVGSINVLALESSKFYRPPKPKPAAIVTNATSSTAILGGGVATSPGGRSLNTVDTLAGVVAPAVTSSSTSTSSISAAAVAAGPVGGSIEAVAAAAAAAEEAAAQEKKRRHLIGEVASQIRVEQVIESIEESAEFDFDYVTLLCIASTIAGIGLATNNSVAIVASMLVSPIMGPVMACTFGTIVNKWSLVHLGAVSELASLFICIVIGFVIGLVTIAAGTGGSWPTQEMRSRGLVDGLAIGLAIAIPSGMGVALSILGNNTSSLVGVAISASLLPPAVNCGMCLAYAAIGFQADPQAIDDDGEAFTNSNSYADLGGISLALVIVNIGAIYLAGCLMFRIKEVAPIQNKRAFWEKDTHVFRKLMRLQNQPELFGLDPSSSDPTGSPGGTAAACMMESGSSDGDGGAFNHDNHNHNGHRPAGDLQAQVNLLKEVGRNPELRRQLMQESDDVLLSLSASAGVVPAPAGGEHPHYHHGVSPLSSLLSTTNSIGARRPKSWGVGSPARHNSSNSNSNNSNSSSGGSPRADSSKNRSRTNGKPSLLDLFREVPGNNTVPSHHYSSHNNNNSSSSSSSHSPSQQSQPYRPFSGSYEPLSPQAEAPPKAPAPAPAASVEDSVGTCSRRDIVEEEVGASGVNSPPGSPPYSYTHNSTTEGTIHIDLQAVKDRLRRQGITRSVRLSDLATSTTT